MQLSENMPKNSERIGTGTFRCEVTGLTSQGFWLMVEGEEYFVPFSDYPAFLKAPLEQIFHFVSAIPGQLRWPDMDIDIEIDSLKWPERFPLSFK